MIVTLANILLRQAEKTQNARGYLDDLLTAKWSDLNSQTGQIVGTTVNGKSLTLQAMPGASLADIMSAAELALSCLERGLNRVPRQTYVVFR